MTWENASGGARGIGTVADWQPEDVGTFCAQYASIYVVNRISGLSPRKAAKAVADYWYIDQRGVPYSESGAISPEERLSLERSCGPMWEDFYEKRRREHGGSKPRTETWDD